MTKFKATLLAIAVVAPMATLSLPAAADVDLVVKIAPPVPRIEPVPAPRVGFVWVPGFWDWRGNRHVWVAGTWERERPGYVYARPAWVQRGGEWHLVRGGWNRRDGDHDGVPNARDRDRDNDGVRNRYDHDRDNDGIRNRRDDHPNVPR